MGFIYLINKENTRDYKIGITKNNVEKRLKQLQTGSSSLLLLINTFESVFYKQIEKLLHRHHLKNHVHGEWFEMDDDVVFSFKDLCIKYEEITKSVQDNYYIKNPLKPKFKRENDKCRKESLWVHKHYNT